MKLFGKDKEEKNIDTPKEFGEVSAEKQTEVAAPQVLPKEYGILKGFYISEKASSLNSSGQYVFKVFDTATKNEVKKQVEKSFNVKIKGVRIVNLPKKSRTIGRHAGFKKGFKKAIVALEKGQLIEGFQP